MPLLLGMIHLIDAALSLSIFTLISSHVFSLNLFQKSNRIPIDGNKRTAFDVMVTFLNLNDYELNLIPEEAYQLTMQVADNKVSKEDLIEILRDCIIELF
ncbi:MAG: type II toxin-antitoxin system death-on-curing family toxin [Sphaerospermopsis kisseleviana]